jgi:putative ABC transport system permease protein
MRGIPLAWLQLIREKRRLAAAIAGITFAVTLMLMQLGLRDALYRNATKVHDHLHGDLAIVASQYEYIFSSHPFSQRRLYSALALPQVESVAPIYVGIGTFRDIVKHRERKLLVLGIRPNTDVFDFEGLKDKLPLLRLDDVGVFDVASRPEFGPVGAALTRTGMVTAEVNDRKVKIQGAFRLGPSFGANGHFITSDLNFLRLFPSRKQGLIDIGLIYLKPGADVELARAQLESILPGDVRVLTRQAFIDEERGYWSVHLPIGFIFNLGSALGLVVGMVIVYQILYTDVTDHLAEYATLKAMGYHDRALYAVVLQEALLLSCFGYLPGFFIAQGLYVLAQQRARIPIEMTVSRGVLVFFMTVCMCAISGAIAMRKLASADPAEIF